MVQLEPCLPLVLQQLAPHGAVLPAEAVVACEHSLPLKRRAAALKTLAVWGRLLAANGRDYLIAEGTTGATVRGGVVSVQAKYYFSQDGARWADLPAVDADVARRAAGLRVPLSGDPAFQYAVGGGGADDGGSGGRTALTEVQRLRCIIDGVNAAACVQPRGAVLANGAGEVVPNRLFGGLAAPDKLESYVRRPRGLDEGPRGGLADDVRSSWAVRHDGLTGVTVLRSLLWPGYSFFFSGRDARWGALYVGDGLRNDDLVFML